MAERVSDLIRRCQSESEHRSCCTMTAQLESYQAILGRGQEAIADLLAMLDKAPHVCMPALSAITGAEPVKWEHRGYVTAMVEDWKDWGRKWLKEHG